MAEARFLNISWLEHTFGTIYTYVAQYAHKSLTAASLGRECISFTTITEQSVPKQNSAFVAVKWLDRGPSSTGTANCNALSVMDSRDWLSKGGTNFGRYSFAFDFGYSKILGISSLFILEDKLSS